MTSIDDDFQTDRSTPHTADASPGADLPEWGAVPLEDGRVRFRLWAPDVEASRAPLVLRLKGTDHEMNGEGDGWFSLVVEANAGDPYEFVVPSNDEKGGRVVPDPASRAQASDVGGPSVVVMPGSYAWQTPWPGRPWEEAVIYELHVGTFTEAGTFRAAIERLDHVADAGFTVIELMPVAQFEGSRGWGYDGVLLYAPHSVYGTPDDLRALVDAAHARGLMVLLDVVYNHFGPAGNHLMDYASDFFHAERVTPWGAAIAFDRAPVRRFVIDNVLYWIDEFHLDGLRFDAIDHVDDPSDVDILVEAAQEVRARITDRPIHLTTEDNRNITHLHERGADGAVPLFTAEWNDDLHNVAHVVATHETEGYYIDFASHRWEYLARALAEGFAYTGQVSPQTGKARGTSSAHLPPAAFVDFLQNHDQIGNRAFGERLSALTGAWQGELLSAVLLLSPHIPLMFMGEESPFCFFANFEGDLAQSVTEGRRREFEDFDGFATTGVHHVPDPNAEETFLTSKLDWACRDTEAGQGTLDRVRRLIALRREHVIPHLAATQGHCGTILADHDGAIAIDWRLGGGADGTGGILLQLRANFSDEARDMPPASGTCIHCVNDPVHGIGDAVGAPHSALHFVEIMGGS